MKTLFLLRHAKSSWHDPDQADRDRPLNNRGRRAAPMIGAWMAQQGLAPHLILCSPAQRALDTAGLILPHLQPAPELRVEEAIYMASPQELLQVLATQAGTADQVMLVGHNPGLQELALHLAWRGSAKARAALAEKFPTAALVVIRFARTDWALHRGGAFSPDKFDGGTLVSFTVPKSLV